MLGGAAPEEDIRISENMTALELAVRNRIPAAIFLDKLITGESKYLLDKVKYMFSGVKDGMKYVKCEHCNGLLGHKCQVNLDNCQIKGNFVCLVCFATCFDHGHLMGHLLMHSSV